MPRRERQRRVPPCTYHEALVVLLSHPETERGEWQTSFTCTCWVCQSPMIASMALRTVEAVIRRFNHKRGIPDVFPES